MLSASDVSDAKRLVLDYSKPSATAGFDSQRRANGKTEYFSPPLKTLSNSVIKARQIPAGLCLYAAKKISD